MASDAELLVIGRDEGGAAGNTEVSAGGAEASDVVAELAGGALAIGGASFLLAASLADGSSRAPSATAVSAERFM